MAYGKPRGAPGVKEGRADEEDIDQRRRVDATLWRAMAARANCVSVGGPEILFAAKRHADGWRHPGSATGVSAHGPRATSKGPLG